MKRVFRWALSSTKRFEINYEQTPPRYIIDLLLKNESESCVLVGELYIYFLDLKELGLYKYSLSTAKRLVESKQFDHIDIGRNATQYIHDVFINTKELEICNISLEEILGLGFIRTNSLTIDLGDRKFDDTLFTMHIRFVFCFNLF